MEMTLRQHIDAYDPPPTAETDEMLRRLSSRLNAWERVHATNNYHLVRTVYADFRPPSPEPWAMLHHKVHKSACVCMSDAQLLCERATVVYACHIWQAP